MTKKVKLNLVLSCFITHKRDKFQGSRIKEFLSTLHSYGNIAWNNVYLFIKLDTDLSHYEAEVEYIARAALNYKCIDIKFERITTKVEWQDFFNTKLGSDQLWWFTQNDDHPYLNKDALFFKKILFHLSNQGNPSSIYLSHWPEILRVASNQQYKVIDESLLEFRGLLLDSIQIFNEQMIFYIFYQLDWPPGNLNRIDSLIISNNIADGGISLESHSQTILVPLKELCRKFIGYDHVKLNFPTKLTFFPAIRPVLYDDKNLLRYVTADHVSAWAKKNIHQLSNEIIKYILLNNGTGNCVSSRHSKVPFITKKINMLRERSYYFLNIFLFPKRILRKIIRLTIPK